MSETYTQAWIGLGSNLGKPAETLLAAAQDLAGTPGIHGLRLSPFYCTAPVGCEGPDYVNAVASIGTQLDAHELLTALQAIESGHGRERPWRNAPRTLDLDLLLYGGQQINTTRLVVPHPRMHERAFVLQPLYDLAPGLQLSQGRLPDLLQNCSDQPIHRLPDAGPAVRMVVAYTRGRVIGHAGGMPWHLPADLAHFKRNTLGHPIIMGRKTWESLGRPLPGRRNLVLSRDPGFMPHGAQCYASLEDALHSCHDAELACVIGGEQIFRLALPLAGEILATEIDADIKGDTWFPELPPGQWTEDWRRPQPPENGLRYDFVRYVKTQD